jgi:hypothetical protein
MLAFEVSLNGELLYVAGFSEGLSLATEVRAFHLPPGTDVPGLVNVALMTAIPSSPPDNPSQPIRWGGTRGLSVGDIVSVRIVDVDQTSEPDGPGQSRPAAHRRR